MIDTAILFWIGGGATALLVITVLLGDLFDFMDFDIGGDTVGAGVLLAFLAVFCFTAGILTNETDFPFFVCLALGAVAGGILGFGMVKILNSLKNGEDGEIGRDGYKGVTGIVTLGIPENGSGTIHVTVGGHGLSLTAQSSVGAIPKGAKVEVTDDMGAFNVMVKPVSNEEVSLIVEKQ